MPTTPEHRAVVLASQEEKHRLRSWDLIIVASQAILDHLGTLLVSTMQTLYGMDSSAVVRRVRAAVQQTSLGFVRRSLHAPISDDLEVRICLDQNLSDENVALEFFELYIK